MSRIFKVAAPELGYIIESKHASSTTLELWLDSLNHVSFMHSAALSIAIASYNQQFCSFVGGALQQNHNFTEHAQEATAYN